MDIPDFLASLGESTHEQLANAMSAGLLDARLAAQCIAGPHEQHAETVELLQRYLARAIGPLERARAIITERLEG